jgi:hypothetical protein
VNLAVILEQFYKDPSLPVPADPSVIAEAVAQGVESGLLGVGSGTQEEIVPSSVKFEERVAATWVNFSEDMFLLRPDHAQALRQLAIQPVIEIPPPGPGPQPPIPGPVPPIPGPVPPGPVPTPLPPTPGTDNERLKRVALRASGIPVSKIADLNRGVILPLSREVGDFTFTIEIDIRSGEGIPRKVIEQQVQETLRQLGASVQNLDRSE